MPSAVAITRDEGTPRVAISGPLDRESVLPIWDDLLGTIREMGVGGAAVTVDLAGVTTCDGAGLGLLIEAECATRTSGASLRFDGASADLEQLLSLASFKGDPGPVDARQPGLVVQVGVATSGLLDSLRGFVGFVGTLSIAMLIALTHLSMPRVKEIVRNCVRVGADAVPVVCLLGALIGFILSVQAVKALMNIGATSLVPMIVGFATLREFAPLIAGIILAGRSGSAFAAELGTMKVTEELDAYSTMALDPMVILVAPRVISATLVMPLLAMFSMILGILGGFVPLITQGYTLTGYLNGVIDSVVVADVVQALVKATVFGLVVSTIGCFQGLQTGRGADAVGASATRAVVAGIVAVLVADSLLSSIFYSLGF